MQQNVISLQCVTYRCNVSHIAAMCHISLQYITYRCNMSHIVAICHKLQQYVTYGCSMLHIVAICHIAVDMSNWSKICPHKKNVSDKRRPIFGYHINVQLIKHCVCCGEFLRAELKETLQLLNLFSFLFLGGGGKHLVVNAQLLNKKISSLLEILNVCICKELNRIFIFNVVNTSTKQYCSN